MTLHFTLSEFGRSFATRGRGEELRGEGLDRAAPREDIVLDFRDVSKVTYSFADELVGKLMAEDSMGIGLANMTPNVARSVERAVRRRRAAPVSC